MYGAWRDKYLDYNGLKTELKRRTVQRSWSDQDEGEFTKILEVELEKIHKFQCAKVSAFPRTWLLVSARVTETLIHRLKSFRPELIVPKEKSTSSLKIMNRMVMKLVAARTAHISSRLDMKEITTYTMIWMRVMMAIAWRINSGSWRRRLQSLSQVSRLVITMI